MVVFFTIAGFFAPCSARAEEPMLVIESGGSMGLIRDLIFSRNGQILISAGYDKQARLWDVNTGETASVIRWPIGEGDDGKIYAAALSPDESLLALAGYTRLNDIKLIDYDSKKVVKILTGHLSSIQDMAFSPDGAMLASCEKNGDVILWDTRNWSQKHTIKAHEAAAYSVAFTPDGKHLLTGGFDNHVKIISVDSGAIEYTYRGHTNKVRPVDVSADGRFVASGDLGGTVRLWDPDTGRDISDFGYTADAKFITHLKFSPTGRHLLVARFNQSNRTVVDVVSVPDGNVISTLAEHDHLVYAGAWSPDGALIATGGGNDYPVYLWDPFTGQVKHRMSGAGRCIFALAVDEQGQKIAFGNTPVPDFGTEPAPLEQVFSLDEMQIQSAPESGEKWRRERHKLDGLELHPLKSNSLELTRDGTPVAEINLTGANNEIRSFSFTPDGSRVVVGTNWGGLRVFSADSSATLLMNLQGHTDDVVALAPAPDGKTLFSGSRDQTIRLWSLDTGELLLTFFFASDNEWAAWTPYGYYTSSYYGDRFIGWQVNKGIDDSPEYYFAYRFRRQFDRPDIIERIFNADSVNTAIFAANVMRETPIPDIRQSQLVEILPPAVFIDIQDTQARIEKDNAVTVHVEVKSVSDEPIQGFRLLRDGRPVADTFTPSTGDEKNNFIIEHDVALYPGLTEISVIAWNRYAVSEQKRVEVSREPDPEEMLKPDLYVLAVGVSDYSYEKILSNGSTKTIDLDYADDDALGIADFFKTRDEDRLFNQVHVKVITDKDATRSNIINEGLEWIFRESSRNVGSRDLSILFLAGHGIQGERGGYYFLSHEADFTNYVSEALNWTEITNTITALRTKVLLLVDTCHSGYFTEDTASGSLASRTGRGEPALSADIRNAIKNLMYTENGVAVITAATGDQDSLEDSELGHGLFTGAVLQGLSRDADDAGNKDGIVDLEELIDFVKKTVTEMSRGEQEPDVHLPENLQDIKSFLKLPLSVAQ